MVESGWLPGKGRIRASNEKLSGRVREKGRISVSTEKRKNPGEYREIVESAQVSKNCTDKFRKKGRISVSTEKVSRLIPKKGQISVTTEKW